MRVRESSTAFPSPSKFKVGKLISDRQPTILEISTHHTLLWKIPCFLVQQQLDNLINMSTGYSCFDIYKQLKPIYCDIAEHFEESHIYKERKSYFNSGRT
jgi:hypothetical protein